MDRADLDRAAIEKVKIELDIHLSIRYNIYMNSTINHTDRILEDAQTIFDRPDLKTIEDALTCFHENGEADEIVSGGGITTIRVDSWLLVITNNGRRQSLCFETAKSASRAMEDF